jgi:molecular chaperone GrpE
VDVVKEGARVTDPGQPEIPQSAGDDPRETPQGARSPDGAGPGASPESTAAVIDSAELAVISDRLEQLQKLFQTKIIEAERQQAWITQLTSELADYRNDFVFKNVTGRIFRDLIQLHDTIGQTLDPALIDKVTKEDLVSRLRILQKQLLRTFDRQGLEQLTSDGGEQFNEAEQEAIDVRPVARPEDDGLVFQSTRCGFRYGTHLLRPESVIVGRYDPRG